jgi:RecG-like helicase
MKFDVVTLGNHEFDNGINELARRLKNLKADVVCANYDFDGTMLEGLVEPYTIVKKAGKKIGILGLLTDIMEVVDRDIASQLKYQEPADVVNRLAEYLKEELDGLTVEYVHGKMKSAEREKIMTAFAAGAVDVLVSTTVIEVGVNVPSATLMVVENADMFGLAALHQLRGRVGRGDKKSHCILVSEAGGEAARARLRILKDNHDGYKIAELDLAMRGPGDFIAERGGYVRQSGEVSFRLATLSGDSKMLYDAFEAAKETYASDPQLELPENAALKERLFEKTEARNDL